MLSRYAFLCCPFAIIACGGKSGSMTMSEDIAGQWRDYCQKETMHQATCGTVFDEAGCNERATCLQNLLRSGVIAGLTSCLLARSCGTNDDACFA
jgi:hypothetical protein